MKTMYPHLNLTQFSYKSWDYESAIKMLRGTLNSSLNLYSLSPNSPELPIIRVSAMAQKIKELTSKTWGSEFHSENPIRSKLILESGPLPRAGAHTHTIYAYDNKIKKTWIYNKVPVIQKLQDLKPQRQIFSLKLLFSVHFSSYNFIWRIQIRI